MQEIEAKRKLRASEGAHFFFTLIFLSGSAIIKFQDKEKECRGVDLQLLIDLLFYGLIIWATYLLISIIPRYKNPAIKIFFNFLDICFGIYLFILFIFANKLYFDEAFPSCYAQSPVRSYFTELFLYVTYTIFLILGLAIVTFLMKCILKSSSQEQEELDD